MRFQPAFDIWAVPVDLLKHAQPGQHIYAGERSHRGRFLGVKQSGVVVVAWRQNARSSGNATEYHRTLRNYALGH